MVRDAPDTSAPMALAICTPTCPRPPRPRMATRAPGPTMLQRRVGGDTSAQERGTGSQIQLDGYGARSPRALREVPREYPPVVGLGVGAVGPHVCRGAPLLVAGLAHLAAPHEPTKQPTPTRSTLKVVTPGQPWRLCQRTHGQAQAGKRRTPLAAGGMDARAAMPA